MKSNGAQSNGINFDEWRKALEEVTGTQAPPGWITARMYSALAVPPIAIATARDQLKKLVSVGRAESQLFRVETGKQIAHFKLKKR